MKEGITMFRKRGLIAKIKDNYCIVVTREGAYKKVPVPAGGARPGMEISYRDYAFYPLLKPLMLAASILVLLFSLTLFRQAVLPPAAAYVSLDINPSLEMTVNRDMQVIEVSFFNDDGIDLVQEAELEGKTLYEALDTLVRNAIDRNYIKPDQKNLMISTVTAASADTTELDPIKLQQALESAIAAGGFTGEVRVYQVADEVRTMAKQNGLSPGKFVLYEQAKETGAKVTVQEIKQNSVRELVDIYKIKLLPNQKKIIVQQPDNSGRPRVLIEENGKAVPGAAQGKKGGFREDDDENDDEDSRDDSKKDDDEDDKDKGKNEKSGGPLIKKGDRINVEIDVKEDKEDKEDKEETDNKDIRRIDREDKDKDKEVEKKPDQADDKRPADRQQEQENDDESENDDNDDEPSEKGPPTWTPIKQ
jgi:hypothetical protein